MKNNKINLYPSILTGSSQEFVKQLALVKKSQAVKVVQIDVIDGYFVDNITLGPLDITQADYGELEIDFHLLVEEPIDFVHEIIAIKEYLPIRAVIAQIERMSHQDDYLQEVLSHGWLAGLSLDLHTPVASIDEASWKYLDIVQLMTIQAGAQGNEFHQQALDKITQIRQQSQKQSPKKVEIIVDGGVKFEEIKLLKQHKVESAVIGSGLWDPVQAIKEYAQLMD
jgi:ribulose-phosphate 3-epimerase